MTLSFNLAPANRSATPWTPSIARQQEIGLPDTVATSFSGSAAEFRSSLTSEPFLILAAIVVIYIVLGVLYESYIHPLTILSSLPSAGVGALLAMIVCRDDLSLISLIGIILLIGIVKKNAIMMIDFALEAERNEGTAAGGIHLPGVPAALPADHDDDDGGAARRAAARARTTAPARELRRPLGISIVGGLLLSQFLTLYTTPVIYLYLDRFGRWLQEWRNRERSGSQLPIGTTYGPSRLWPMQMAKTVTAVAAMNASRIAGPER